MPEADTSAKPIVLCVESDASVRDQLRGELVLGLGYQVDVRSASSAASALKFLTETREENPDFSPAVVFCDFLRADGEELLAALPGDTVRILLTDGEIPRAVEHKIRDAGFFRYISKPWRALDLRLTAVEALRSFLGARELAHKNARLHDINRELEALNALLEQRVEERTRELQGAKEKAEESSVELVQLSHELALMAEESNTARKELQQEVAERKKAEEEARRANETKSAFLANMSHELRTPLNAIIGFSQLLQRNQDLPEPALEQISIINRSGTHLLRIINDVLDMSRIEAGRQTLSEDDFDLRLMLDDLTAMFRLRAEEKQLDMRFEIDSPRYMYGDEKKLRQMLINLLGNALKFTEQGEVVLSARLENAEGDSPRAIFIVRDTGPGLSAEEQERIFEAFTQAGAGQKAQQGTGLGLAISREFALLMEGDLTVESELGRGSSFRIDIPYALPRSASLRDGRAPEGEKIPVGPAADQPALRILIVDDEWDNRQLLMHLLGPFGFELREAENGREAVQAWSEWRPHMIWLDLLMPVMDGYETAREIRGRAGGDEVVIVAVTAGIMHGEKDSALEAGCDDMIHKPFRREAILNVMAEKLDVRYDYEKPGDASEVASEPSGVAAEICGEDMGAQSPEDREELRRAVLETDLSGMLRVIERIEARDQTLAAALAGWARNFQYDKILELLDESPSGEP